MVGASANAPAAGSAAVAMPPAAAQPGVEVTPAKIVKRVLPVPPPGVSRKTTGYVVVRFNITEAGRVEGVEVVESKPAGVFDDSAKSAVRRWTYEPRKENGAAVASSAQARLVFDLAN
jgi:TonB family protein